MKVRGEEVKGRDEDNIVERGIARGKQKTTMYIHTQKKKHVTLETRNIVSSDSRLAYLFIYSDL